MLPGVRSFPTGGAVGHGERLVVCPNCKSTMPVVPNTLKIVCPVCNRTVETTVVASVQQR